MSQRLLRHQNWNITITEMSPKLICHQNWNVTKSEMSPKLKFHQNWIVTKTEVSSKLKGYQIIIYSKIKIKIQEIGTEYLGLVWKGSVLGNKADTTFIRKESVLPIGPNTTVIR